MNEDVEPEPVKSAPSMRRFIIYAGLLLAVFPLGLVPKQSREQKHLIFETARARVSEKIRVAHTDNRIV